MSDYFVKLYASILDSSVWGEAAETRLVWITLLAMADPHGFVESSLPGLARRANVTLEACTSALGVLSAPDPHSKSEEHEGRRVEKVTRGWLVLNYEAYREMRTRSQDDAARRKREQRAREKAVADATGEGGHGGVTEGDSHGAGVTVTPVTDASTSTSPSPSGSSSSLKPDQQQKPVGRERATPADLDAFMAEQEFGGFADVVSGYVRGQRSPIAVMATLRMHLSGELNHEQVTPEQLGLAVQQYSANQADDRFNPLLFAGFVRKAKTVIERGGNRKRNAAEQQTIAEEQRRAEERRLEEAEGKIIAFARREHPERFAELGKIADATVPKKYSGEMREHMIYPALLDLVRREWPDAR